MRAAAAASVICLVVLAAGSRSTAKEVPLVHTEGGRLSGIVEESEKGREFYSFYGIPFAQPPVGKLRFKDPESSITWDGTRDASTPAPPCLQHQFNWTGVIPAKEDCLYLNVFTPKIRGEEELPVMIWIHGGGFFCGGAQDHHPHVFLDQDVVLVVVQYRLGVLGFLSTEDSVMPGNLGLKDQTMALQWVQRNIHHFGGDKTKVTIFGVSAGAASVHYQMLTPKAEGLFTRAILQSGTAVCPWTLNNNPRATALRVANTLGCPTEQTSQVILDCLQQLDAEVIFPFYEHYREWGMFPFVFTPWVDGHYLQAHPALLVREGRHAQVDIISGVTRDEGALNTLPALQTKSLLEDLHSNFNVAGPASLHLDDLSEDPVAVARRLYLHYCGTTHVTEAHAENLNRMFGDHYFSVCHDLTTAHHAFHLHPSKKTFRYELQHRGQLSLAQFLCPSCDQQWVSHGDDSFYLFPNFGQMLLPVLKPTDQQRSDDLALRNIILTLWTNFAATGIPTPDDSLGFKWEPSTADNLHYLSLTPSPSMQPDNREEARKFHNSLPTPENLILHPHLVERGTGEPQDAVPSSKTEL